MNCGLGHNWPTEVIDDTQVVFHCVHRARWMSHFLQPSQVSPGAFSKQGECMSVDWAKYASAESARQTRKVPEDNAVVEISLQKLRDAASVSYSVSHDPKCNGDQHNRAHSLIDWKDSLGARRSEDWTALRLALSNVAVVVIGL